MTVHCVFEDLREEVREAEALLQAKVKERDILKGFKVGIIKCVSCSLYIYMYNNSWRHSTVLLWLQEKEYMVNQVMIEQLRDEMKENTQDCEVYKDSIIMIRIPPHTVKYISVIDFSPGENH